MRWLAAILKGTALLRAERWSRSRRMPDNIYRDQWQEYKRLRNWFAAAGVGLGLAVYVADEL